MYPYGPSARGDAGARSDAGQARRLACGAESELLDHLKLDGVEFKPTGDMPLIIEQSVCLLRLDAYSGMPREERDRPQDCAPRRAGDQKGRP